MVASPAPADVSLARERARRIDGVLLVTAIAAAAAAASAGTSASSFPLLVAGATAAATLAALRPWNRARAARAAGAAVADAESERNRALASAAQHAARWQAIVDTATEAIVTIDTAGLIESVNGAASRMFGYAADELVGRNVKVLMPEPYRGEHDGYVQRYLRTGERHIIGIGREVKALRKDGTQFPIMLSVGEAEVAGRRFFTGMIRDITDQHEMQTKLAQTERLVAVGELAAGVAHEINNPINTIINCAQLIHDGDDPLRNSEVIREEGERIADIVRDLLQFSRDDRDRAQSTSVQEVVARTLRLLGENWQRHGIRLEVDVAEPLPLVQARPQQLQQVLLNLLINAKDALLQAEGCERRVWLAVHAVDQGVALTVRDSGPGVPPQLGNRVFEPFVTTKRARGGTGLGLSISKSIVEGYGGTIALRSEPGRGAEFRVWLPQAPPE
jgi:two-component system sensor kinase FixL